MAPSSPLRATVLILTLVFVCGAGEVDARRKDKEKHEKGVNQDQKPHEKQHGHTHEKQHGPATSTQPVPAVASQTDPAPVPGDSTSPAGKAFHRALMLLHLLLLGYCFMNNGSSDKPAAFRRACSSIISIFAFEALAHALTPQPHLSVGVMIFVSVVFTIAPVEDAGRMGLHMGTVPPLCVLWLSGSGILSAQDLVRSLYGTESLRPYHLVVMFLGSVYLCTALERSGFLHAAAVRVVEHYGRSPWGLFWALGCFSGCLTVLIPDDIVTMTLTPITIRMCQLLNLPEIPYLFSQFFAGNIWAVTLVTGNPTNVLLAEDLGDTFVSFAGRMGIPGIAAGLASFLLMWITNRSVINAQSGAASELGGAGGGYYAKARSAEACESGEGAAASPMLNSAGEAVSGSSDASGSEEERGRLSHRLGGGGAGGDTGGGGGGGGGEGGDASSTASSRGEGERRFTRHGVICLLRVLVATLICALESVHGLPVYKVVLIMGVCSFLADLCVSVPGALDVLHHMPWELFSFVTGFLVLAEAMAITGVSLWLASAFLPLVASRNVAYVSGFVTMLFCNVFETLPATLIVFKMIDSVPAWKAASIVLAPIASQAHLRDAKRAALSAVIFGSNFGANTACIGSLGGLMMRRLALQQGVTVTNGMLLKQGIPVMIPTMLVACYVLVHQRSL